MPEQSVMRSAAPECMVTFKSDGQVVMSQHTRGFEGVLWQLGAIAAFKNLSAAVRSDFGRVAGFQPGIGLAAFADQFAEVHLEALRMTTRDPELASLLPTQLRQQVSALGQSLQSPTVDLPTARWVLTLLHGAGAGVPQEQGKPVPVGRIVRVSDGMLTRYAVLETPMGDPIWISIARTGIVVKRSAMGFLGQVIFQGTPEESARKTQQLDEVFGGVQLPTSVNNPVLRVWIQAAICMRDAAQFIQAVR